MNKRRTRFDQDQAVVAGAAPSAGEVAVQVPLPLVASLRAIRQSFFELCILVGQQVLAHGMEQDRVALCGPKGRHEPGR